MAVTKTDGEAIAVLQTNMENIVKRLDSIDASMVGLHTKVDTFTKVLSDNYVPNKAFEEYKSAQAKLAESQKRELAEKEKAKNLEKVIWLIVGTVVTSLIAFFFREAGV